MMRIRPPISPSSMALAILLALLCIGGAGLSFSIACIDGCGPYHQTSSTADLDGDGDLDAVFYNRRHENEYNAWSGTALWTNLDGKELTSSGLQMPELPPDAVYDTTTGDVNNDGRADLVLLAFNQLRFYLNQGGDPEQDPVLFQWDGSIHGAEEQGLSGTVALGDLDGDGDLDGFVAGCCGMLEVRESRAKPDYWPSFSWVWINEQQEGGRLAGRSISLRDVGDLAIRQAALGDLDGDGDLDVYAAVVAPKPGSGAGAPADRVLLNDGSGRFTDSGQSLAAGHRRSASGMFDFWLRGLANRQKGNGPDQDGSTAAALGDLDGDGDLDVLAGNRAGAHLWINQGGEQGGQAGTFGLAEQRIPGGPTEAVFLVDLDGDGDPDALVGGRTQAAVWWNDGQGRFRDSGQVLRHAERDGLAVGDFNGDGSPEVFAASSGPVSRVWVFQGGGR